MGSRTLVSARIADLLSREPRSRRQVIHVHLSHPGPGRRAAVTLWLALILAWLWGAVVLHASLAPAVLVELASPDVRAPGLSLVRLVNRAPVPVRLDAVAILTGPGPEARAFRLPAGVWLLPGADVTLPLPLAPSDGPSLALSQVWVRLNVLGVPVSQPAASAAVLVVRSSVAGP